MSNRPRPYKSPMPCSPAPPTLVPTGVITIRCGEIHAGGTVAPHVQIQANGADGKLGEKDVQGVQGAINFMLVAIAQMTNHLAAISAAQAQAAHAGPRIAVASESDIARLPAVRAA